MSASVSRSIGRNIHGAPGRPRGVAFHGKRSHRHLVLLSMVVDAAYELPALTRELAAGFWVKPKPREGISPLDSVVKEPVRGDTK